MHDVVASFATIVSRLSQIMEDLCRPFICNYPPGFIISSIGSNSSLLSRLFSFSPPLCPSPLLSGYTFDELTVIHYLGRSILYGRYLRLLLLRVDGRPLLRRTTTDTETVLARKKAEAPALKVVTS